MVQRPRLIPVLERKGPGREARLHYLPPNSGSKAVTPISTRVRPAAVAALLALVIAGCERADTRLEHLSAGIAKDSALALMGATPERTDPYLYQGQYIEALFFARPGGSGPEAKEDRRMSPVIVINGQLAGWGWAYWDSVAAANSIPVAPKK